MRIGFLARNMGPQAIREALIDIARSAEAVGLDDLWVVDHIAIPPDDAEGSEGRYLDPLTTLAFLAGHTERIGLGVAVLILPYRPALPTAKSIATIQELSGERLRLGVGAGWMKPEFKALGVPRSRRGAMTDETLVFLNECFANDVVERGGQSFLFRPRPARPPIYVGGAAKVAFPRLLAHGDGWLPMSNDPDALREPIATLRAQAAELGRPRPEVITMMALESESPAKARDQIGALEAVGVDGVIHIERYADSAAARKRLEAMAPLCGGGGA